MDLEGQLKPSSIMLRIITGDRARLAPHSGPTLAPRNRLPESEVSPPTALVGVDVCDAIVARVGEAPDGAWPASYTLWMRGRRRMALGALLVLVAGCGSGDQEIESGATASPVTATVLDVTTTTALVPSTSAPRSLEVGLTEQCAQPPVAMVTEALQSVQVSPIDDACMGPGVVEQLAALEGVGFQFEVESAATSWASADLDDRGWVVGVALDVFDGDGGGERIIQQWTLVVVDEQHAIIEQIDTLDTDAVVAAGEAVVVEYLAHLAAARYSDAAALLGEGGMSWPDRPDLAALADAPDTQDALADALEAWCDSGALCAEADSVAARADIRGASADVTATWDVDDGEVTATFIAGEYEGQPTVVGLPPLSGEASLATIAEITGAETVVAALADGRVVSWVGGRTSQILAPLDASTWSDGRFVYWATYPDGDAVPRATAAGLDGSIICEAAGRMASLRQRSDGSFVATVERDHEATPMPTEYPIPNYAVDCATGISTAIDPVSFGFEGGARTVRSVAGRTFTVHFDAEGNGDVMNAEGISVNGDDYAGFHTFSPDGTRLLYGNYGGGVSPHVTRNIAVRNTADGSLLWRAELPRPFGDLQMTDERVVAALPSRDAEFEPWINTELLAVFDASDGTLLASVPTSIDILHLG